MSEGESFNIHRFLEDYQQFPCLWKKESAEFKIRSKRDHAEECLLKSSGLASVKVLRKKIRSIRCTYNQELAKIKKSMRTGSATTDIYKPKLSWFSMADSFLGKDFEDERFTQSNLELSQNVSRDMELQIEDETNDSTLPPGARKIADTVSTKVARKKKDCPIDNAVNYLKELASRTSQGHNEFVAFGQHIASQLQCLPLDEAVRLQGEIQQLITTARLRCIQETTFVPSNASLVLDTSNNLYDSSAPGTSNEPSRPNSSESVCDSYQPVAYFANWNGTED